MVFHQVAQYLKANNSNGKVAVKNSLVIGLFMLNWMMLNDIGLGYFVTVPERVLKGHVT